MSQNSVSCVIKTDNNKNKAIMNIKSYIISALCMSLPLMSCVNSNAAYKSEPEITGESFTSGDNSGYNKKVLSLKNFNAINNECGVEIIYTQEKSYKATLYGSAKALSGISVTADNGTIFITDNPGRKRKSNSSDEKIRLEISSPDLQSIRNSGAMKFRSKTFKSDDFTIDNSGALDIEAEEIKSSKYRINNSGSIKLYAKIKTG